MILHQILVNNLQGDMLQQEGRINNQIWRVEGLIDWIPFLHPACQTSLSFRQISWFISFLCPKLVSLSYFSLLSSQSIPAMPDHPRMDTSVSGNNGLPKGHVKKPLNAFMLYMKDMRSKVVSECTLKESAAINQILGKRVMPNYRLL